MGLTIRIEGAQAAVQELQHLDERLHGSLRPLLESITQVMASTFKDRFHQGPPPGVTWAPLDPVTLAIRRRHGHGGKHTLVRGGELRDSIRPLAQGPDYVEVGTTLEYAADVQEGGTVTRGRGRSRQLPPRPFVVLGDEDLADLEDMVVRYFTGGEPLEGARA